ncbi:MAG: hypothetical protein J6M59_13005 [Bacteroidaceae bacterium]|nr:hypothetical protein [Bacteroidaceae bacterium]
MGWDVVQIGLRHNLPIDDPFEMANEVAKRMSRNIRLVCWNDFELDKSNNIVRHDFDYDLIELGEINKESRILYPIQIGIIASVLRPDEPNLPIQIDNQLRNYR